MNFFLRIFSLIAVMFFVPSFALAEFIYNNATGGDCASFGVWNQETKTCTLKQDLTLSNYISVANGLTLDGGGHTLKAAKIGQIVYGVLLGTGATLKNATISGFNSGIYANSDTTIENNIFYRNNYGIFINTNTKNLNIKNNIFEGGFYGIFTTQASNINIESNEFKNISSWNLNLKFSDNVMVVGNDFTKEYPNLVYVDNTKNSKFYNNNFIWEKYSAFFISGYGIETNKYDNGVEVGGNYWSMYDSPEEGCNDLNKDGYCDSRYSIEGQYSRGYDNFPFTKPLNLGNKPKITPVLIIPGISGSELYNNSDLIWLDLSRMFFDINDQFLTENLSLTFDGQSINNITSKDIIYKLSNKDIFEGFAKELDNNNYKYGISYFSFPYDWRLDLKETKHKLNQKIEEIKLETGSDKVDIVAHSMGGLLAKAYLNQYGQDSVNKLIFIGTPHLGAPKAGKIIMAGDRLGIPWLEEDRIKEIARNSVAVHELLPYEKYFTDFQGYIRPFKIFGTSELLDYQNTKLYLLEENEANPFMFNYAEAFNGQGLQDIDFGNIDVYNIAGCKTSTQAAYGIDFYGGIGEIGYTSGDGTVPLFSADYLNIPLDKKIYYKDAEHSTMPSDFQVRNLIIKILKGENLDLTSNLGKSKDFCGFKGKKLTWHSPVEVHIYDEAGNHTGPSENNTIEYGAQGVDYEIVGHNKFIFLPTGSGQTYEVKAKGLESGSFDLWITDVDNGNNISTNVFNDVEVDQSTHIYFREGENIENGQISVTKDGLTSVVDKTATVVGEAQLDLVPPATQLWLDGKKYKKDGEFKKRVLVELLPEDVGSGVLGTWYSTGGGYELYTKPFLIEGEGIYNLRYYSADEMGNNEEIKENQIIIGKLDKILRKSEN